VEPVLKCCDRAVGDSQLFKFGPVDLRAGDPAAHSVGEWAECRATSPARSPHGAAEARAQRLRSVDLLPMSQASDSVRQDRQRR
jgi:hypothetical protein